MTTHLKLIKIAGKIILSAMGFLAVVPILLTLCLGGDTGTLPLQTEDVRMMDSFDSLMTSVLADAEEGARSVPKHFWINEDDDKLPLRDDSKYGTADSAAELQWLIDAAAPLLDGQELLFNTDIQIREGTKITFYLDESILAITWQQILNRMVYTIAEVKVMDASQFRRYLSDGVYDSGNRYTTAQLSEQAGSVLATSADFFMTRPHGVVVYEGEVKRFHNAYLLDYCFVDMDGNFIMVPRNTFQEQSEVEAFIEEHNINFNLAFGPILVKDGVQCDPLRYPIGETNDGYPRAAICQKDELHYLAVVTNGNGGNFNYPTMHMFAEEIVKFDVLHAYAMDGGRTGAIVMQDQFLNPSEYRAGPRLVGDILSFVTAVPNQE